MHPIDASLASLDLSVIEPLNHSSQEFQALEKYAQDTHGDTHDYYKVEVEDIFRIQRRADDGVDLSAQPGERLLLWHGSRSTNFAGAELLIGIDGSDINSVLRYINAGPSNCPTGGTGYWIRAFEIL